LFSFCAFLFCCFIAQLPWRRQNQTFSRQGRNADELVALTKRGMPPLEVIRAATVNAAELMGWRDNVGAIESGRYADVIAVDGDPLADISILQHVKFVMKGGSVVKDEIHQQP
jgi:imidazolonepropionase-like amidohydrolase